MNKQKTATFIGHSECYKVTDEQIKQEIIKLIDLGVTNFISGGQGNFDKKCGYLVHKLKKDYPQIKNILVIPYLTFKIYDKTIFDEIIYPDGFENLYFKAAIPERNKYLVDNSNYAICYISHTFGGAFKTYTTAKNKKLNIINLGELKL